MTIKTFAAGSSAVAVVLPAWGFAALDDAGIVEKDQMPISSDELKRALVLHLYTGVTWLQYIEDWVRANHGKTTDPINISWNGGRIRLDDPIWDAIKDQLNVVTGSFGTPELAALIAEIRTNR
jgi:hypothetical protein